MGLRFIIGRSGTGKTRLCLEEIAAVAKVEPLGPPLLFIAPDQATYQLERDLLTVGGLHGYMRPSIVSFQRLAYRIIAEAGGGHPPTLGSIGRRVLLARLVKSRLEDIRYFTRSLRHAGFFEQLDRMLQELFFYNIDETALRNAAESARNDPQAPANIADKLEDLALLVGDYRKELGQTFLDPNYTLTLAANQLCQTRSFQHCRIWLDGFAEFTPQQLLLLRRLMRIADSTTVALNLDPETVNRTGPRQDSLFYTTEQTYFRFLDIGAEEQMLREPDVLLTTPHRFKNEMLREAERIALLPPEIKATYTSVHAEGIQVYEAPNQRAEIAWIARSIRRLAREKAIRYRQIAVIVRNLEPYESHIREIFESLDIPTFIDRRRDIAHHPLIEFIRSAVELAHGGWRRDPLFRYLRTGFFDRGRYRLSPDRVDRLEMLVLERGLEDARWSNEALWTEILPQNEEQFDENVASTHVTMDHLRWKHLVEEPLVPLFHLFRNEDLYAHDVVECLLDLMDRLNVEETLECRQTEALNHRDPFGAQEHEQAYSGVRETLEQLRASAGTAPLPRRHLLELLDIGLQELTLGFIPPSIDSVLVGTIERSRQPKLQTVFLPGFAEGAYPRSRDPGGILADEDRAYLQSARVTLAPNRREALYAEPYITYVAFTRASHQLVITYPRSDDDGKRINPSPYLTDLRKRFPDIPIQLIPFEHEQPSEDPQAAAIEIGLQRIRNNRQSLLASRLYQRLYDDAAFAPMLHLIDRAQDINNPYCLDTDCLDLFRQVPLQFSISRLERYSACPFQHFARYGLQLKPLEPFVLEARHLGTVAHHVLEQLIGGWIRDRRPWRTIELSDAIEEADAILNDFLQQAGTTLSMESSRDATLLNDLRGHLHLLIDIMLQGARAAEFEPVAVEYDLAESAYQLEVDGQTIQLIGRIDRVDTAQFEGNTFVRVIDYKTSPKVFQWAEWFHGLQLQLATYLLAVAHGETPRIPAGAFYLPIRGKRPSLDSIRKYDPSNTLQHWLDAYKYTGFFAEEFYPLFDKLLQPGDKSKFYKLAIKTRMKKTDASPVSHQSNDPIEALLLEKVLRTTQERLIQFSREILAGRIQAEPYEFKKKTPCEWCDYGAVCRFDMQNDTFRFLESLNAKQVKERLREGGS